jgi:hypothetical protein
MAYFYDEFVNDCELFNTAGETVHQTPTGDSCYNKVVHPETEILRLPTPGLGDCSGGCECGPGAPILTDQAPSCEGVNLLANAGHAPLINTFCKMSFEGDVEAGTGVPCERLYDAATGNITCTTGSGTCIVPEPDCSTSAGGCPCGPLAPVYTTSVPDCSTLTDTDACRESYQGDPTTNAAVPCRLGEVTTEDVITYTQHIGGCTGTISEQHDSADVCRDLCTADPDCSGYQPRATVCNMYSGPVGPSGATDYACYEKIVTQEVRGQICSAGPGLCTAVAGPVPTPGLESCRGSGCVCGPTEPMLFNHVDDCSAIVEHNTYNIVCQSSYQGSLENGTAVICERVMDDGGVITCAATPETPCLAEPPCDSDEDRACAVDPCDNYALNTHAIDGSCCQCPAAGFDAVEDPVSHDNITGNSYTRMKLVYDLPPGYTLGFVGGGAHLGLNTALVAPAAFQVAAPFGSSFGPPPTAFVDIMPVVAYDSYVTVGDYNTFNGTAGPDQWFLYDTISESITVDWDQNGGILTSSTDVMYAQGYPNGPWNTGSGAVVFQLTISKAESYDSGCGPGGSPCATALIGGAIDPLGTSPVTDATAVGSDGSRYLTNVQWVRQVTWYW